MRKIGQEGGKHFYTVFPLFLENKEPTLLETQRPWVVVSVRGHVQTIFGKINVIVTLRVGPPPPPPLTSWI